MAQVGSSILATLRRARDDQLKELNTTISVVEKLVDAIAAVESSLSSPLERKVGKSIIEKLHSFLVRKQ